MPPPALPPDPIGLRHSDRAVLIGASGTGKSTLAAELLNRFRRDYPHARILVLDTKPRWRGERLPDGRDARRLYRGFAPGDTIPGAVTMSQMRDWTLAWDHDTNPTQTVIAQRVQTDWKDRQANHANTLAYVVACAERFFGTQRVKTPSLLYLDEGHDFFHSSGQARGTDIVQRCYRAGRERGLATLAGFQRPSGLNLQVLTELNYCALFRINFAKDVKKLYDMGWPEGVPPPDYEPNGEESFTFRLWRGKPTAPTYRLNPRTTAHTSKEARHAS